MKLFGYSATSSESLLELSSATIQAGPSELRRLAKFLEHCASRIEANSAERLWEHEHFCDHYPEEPRPDIVVASPYS